MYPQTLLNVRVAPEVKAGLAEHAQVVAALEHASARLNGEGRVNVRPSGTEPPGPGDGRRAKSARDRRGRTGTSPRWSSRRLFSRTQGAETTY